MTFPNSWTMCAHQYRRLDLIHTIAFDQKPFFTAQDELRHDTAQGARQVVGLNTFDTGQMTLDDISALLLDIPQLTDQELLPDAPPPEPAITPLSFERELQEWYEFLVQAAQSIAPSYDGTLSRACHAAASIHLLTNSAVTPHTTTVHDQTDGLFQAMMAVPENAWDAFERLHLRMSVSPVTIEHRKMLTLADSSPL